MAALSNTNCVAKTPIVLPLNNRMPTTVKIKRITEQELLDNLNRYSSHADELAELLPTELGPLERLKDSVKRYDRPADPVWEEFFESDDGVSDDFLEDRDQPEPDDSGNCSN